MAPEGDDDACSRMEATICHIIDVGRDRLLLKYARRGVSKGKWNGVGGKIEPGESARDCATWEALEETGLRVSRLFRHGTLTFYLSNRRVIFAHLFSTSRYSGVVRSSSEGRVSWYPLSRIPYELMWDDDDRYWMWLMLLRMRFDATFYYDRRDRFVTRCEIAASRSTRRGADERDQPAG